MTPPACPKIGFGVDCEIRASPGAMPGIFSVEITASPISIEIIKHRGERQSLQRVSRLVTRHTFGQFVSFLHTNNVPECRPELLDGYVANWRFVHDLIEAARRMNTSWT